MSRYFRKTKAYPLNYFAYAVPFFFCILFQVSTSQLNAPNTNLDLCKVKNEMIRLETAIKLP